MLMFGRFIFVRYQQLNYNHLLIHVRENRRDNKEWIIQRLGQYLARETERKQTKQKTQHSKLKRGATRAPPQNQG